MSVYGVGRDVEMLGDRQLIVIQPQNALDDLRLAARERQEADQRDPRFAFNDCLDCQPVK
jgi:hypothetical protein